MQHLILEGKAEDLSKLGFCILEFVHDQDAITHQEELLYSEWVRRGKPELSGFGLGIHPLLQFVPDIIQYFDCPEVNTVLELAFGSPARLCHTGARIANEDSAENIGWHHHYGWDTDQLPLREKIERVVVNFYVKGVSPSNGSLWTIPRWVGDHLDPLIGEKDKARPGQTEVSVPPGSAVILDTAVYHTATRGNEPGMRYHWGGHYQGWANKRPHGEDMDMSEVQQQDEILNKYPGLRRLVIANDP